MRKYNKIPIVEQDYNVLKSLESRIRENIKQFSFDFKEMMHDYDDICFNSFYVEDGKVTQLSISNSEINEFPHEILNLKNLNYLLFEIPCRLNLGDFFTLPNLKKLLLAKIVIEENKSVKELQENLTIETLSIQDAEVLVFPEEIFKFSSLKSLFLVNTQIRQIPNLLENLTHLRNMNLNNNHIEQIPDSINKLRSLEELQISNNSLNNLPEVIGNLPSLKKLNLSSNNLKILPNSIGTLFSLKTLNISSNKLNCIPESIGNLNSIENLFLYENKLKSLPKSIGMLKKLKTLNLRDNCLSNLPESIGDLGSLERLDLRNNRSLSSLPNSLIKLPHVRSISLKGTQILEDNDTIQMLNRNIVDI